MIEGGEDVKFIARRLLILASEDIGNANPNALLLANACFEAVNKIGYPEVRILSFHNCATYPGVFSQEQFGYPGHRRRPGGVRNHGDLAVPLHIRMRRQD